MSQVFSPGPVGRLDLGLHDYLVPPPQRRRWRARAKPAPIVADDWPVGVPISAAELDVLEVHLAEVLDRLLGERCR